ncbi:MAG: hypothetical protein [Bacteriophage sp.]|nr:MAG: hypothetical protein [Bacteriophage sp.]
MLVEVKESNKKYLPLEDRSEYVKSVTWVEDKDIHAIAESIIQPPSKNAGSSYRIIEYYDKSKEDTVYKHVTYENYLEIVSLMTHLSDNYNTRLYDESGYKVVEHDYDSYALVRQWDFNIPNSIEPKPSKVPEDVGKTDEVLQAFDNDYDVVIRAEIQDTDKVKLLSLNYSDILCVYCESYGHSYELNEYYLVLNDTIDPDSTLYTIDRDDYDDLTTHGVKHFTRKFK